MFVIALFRIANNCQEMNEQTNCLHIYNWMLLNSKMKELLKLKNEFQKQYCVERRNYTQKHV